jgi:hypothetical protein
MSGLQEYVEQVVREGFVREADQDENVMRSLPFFATSLSLLATVFGLMHATLCRPASSALALCVDAATFALGACIALSVAFLIRAVRSRIFSYPMPETEFVEYAARVVEAYRCGAPSGGPAALEAAVLAEIRAVRIQQLAEAAEANRANNLERNRARGLALTALIAAIAFAFLLLGLIVAADTLVPGACHA